MRSKQLFEIYHKKAYPDRGNGQRLGWEQLSRDIQLAWYRVACEEEDRLSALSTVWQEEVNRVKAEAATMVSRKHYNDAIKSLSVCQQQIETLMLELKRWNPTSRIAQDASTVLGLLEAMIDANPDMQADESKAQAVHPKMWKDTYSKEMRVMENTNTELRDTLWAVMQECAAKLNVEINGDRY
jgi:hypothetical protein